MADYRNEYVKKGDILDKSINVGLFSNFVSNADIVDMPPAKVISMGVLEQIRWERDVAIDQLAEYGIGFGEKKRDLVKVIRCKDCKWFAPNDNGFATNSPTGYCFHHDIDRLKVDYCSDAERETGNETLDR